MSTRTIKLKKYQDIILEKEAAAAITPGACLELTSADEVQINSNTAGHFPVMVALEDELQGKSTQDDYAAEDPVQIWYVQPGEEFLALIDSAFDPDIGALLEMGADGELVAASGGTAQFQVIAAKEVDDSDNHRIAVRRI